VINTLNGFRNLRGPVISFVSKITSWPPLFKTCAPLGKVRAVFGHAQDHRWAVLRHAQDWLGQPSLQRATGRSIQRFNIFLTSCLS
jgi:hypothetical protein